MFWGVNGRLRGHLNRSDRERYVLIANIHPYSDHVSPYDMHITCSDYDFGMEGSELVTLNSSHQIGIYKLRKEFHKRLMKWSRNIVSFRPLTVLIWTSRMVCGWYRILGMVGIYGKYRGGGDI